MAMLISPITPSTRGASSIEAKCKYVHAIVAVWVRAMQCRRQRPSTHRAWMDGRGDGHHHRRVIGGSHCRIAARRAQQACGE